MVIDFHIHSKITRLSCFDKNEFFKKLENAKNNGFTALILLEHSFVNGFSETYNFLKENYSYYNYYYNINGIKVFVGVEITTNEGLDVVIIGERNLILSLGEKIEVKKGKRWYLDIMELQEHLNCNDILVILAHPFRQHDIFPNIDKSIFNFFDAIELNASDIYEKGEKECKASTYKLSETLGLPIIGGSDSHHSMQIGCIKNIFEYDCKTINKLKEQIKSGRYIIEISNDLNDRIRDAIEIKKIIGTY